MQVHKLNKLRANERGPCLGSESGLYRRIYNCGMVTQVPAVCVGAISNILIILAPPRPWHALARTLRARSFRACSHHPAARCMGESTIFC